MDKEYARVKNWYDNNVAAYAKQSAFLLPKELKLFISFLPKQGKILDVGSGPGQDTEYFAKMNFTALGIDFSKNMIAYAKKNRSNGQFKKMDMLELDKYFPPNYFNGVWASASLVHLKDRDIINVLNKVYKILGPGGVLGLIVKKKTVKKLKTTNTIFRQFSRNEILSFMKACNFKILHISSCRFKILILDDFKINDGEWLFAVAKKL